MNLFRKPHIYFYTFIILNIIFFINIIFFHSTVSFNRYNYEVNAHHYIKDPRIDGGSFNLINSLGQFDAQWYLKIADSGYPVNPKTASMYDDGSMDGFTYAFFPLYPAIVGIFNYFVGNVELAAFLLSIIFLLLNFVSFIYVGKKHFKIEVSVKAAFLMFFFPFSVFLRSFFAEGLMLFLIIWFSYFLYKKDYLNSALLLSLISITKGTAFLLIIIFIYIIFSDFRKGKILLSRMVLIVVLLFTPLAFWALYNYVNTGNPAYFLSTRPYSGISTLTIIPFMSVFHNIALIFRFPLLPLHSFHTSKLDVLTVLIFLLFLIKSRKVIPKTFWLIAFSLWLSPLLVKDMMCYSRFQSVNFPIFIYLAQILKGKNYMIVFILFFISLLVTSLYFVNWWWVG